jgi:hypothetical protein
MMASQPILFTQSPPERKQMKASFLALAAVGTIAQHAVADLNWISVDLGSQYREVTHAASGSLYGISFDGVPPDYTIAPLKPKVFTQMAPNGQQLPNGTKVPTGDALKVAPAAARAGADVMIRMPDWYPTFPYQWVSWTDWTNAVQQQVSTRLAQPWITNIYGWELWNEPDGTWNTKAAGPFNDGWLRTYQLVRSMDTTTPIVGPSASFYFPSFISSFLSYCQTNNVLPDVVTWHELTTPGNADIEGHVAQYRQLEQQLGISPRRVSINEYGRIFDSAVPGFLLRYIARIERAGVDSACLAFWHLPGRLGDLLNAQTQPNGAWWLYKLYGDFSGSMALVTPPATSGFGLDGVAGYDRKSATARVLIGGVTGDTLVTIAHLPGAIAKQGKAHVQAFSTMFTGTDGASSEPAFLFEGDYPVKGSQIVVPVNDMLDATAYDLVVSASSTAVNPKYRYEAEDGQLTGVKAINNTSASDGEYVSGLNQKGSNVVFSVFVPSAGPYSFTIRYSNSTGSPATGNLSVNSATNVSLNYQQTPAADIFATGSAVVQLNAGLNMIEVSNSGQKIRSGVIGLDYIEVKPYQARYEAESATISDANTTICDPDNFTATYASNYAYVAQLNNEDSYVEFTVNAPVAGTYHLNIHYTNGTGVNSQQGLSINAGPFSMVTYQPTEGWGLFGINTMDVQLQSGTNTIRLAKGDPSFGLAVGFAELDCVDLQYSY